MAETEYRAHFDAVVTFVNGGELIASAFRLDLPSPELDSDAVGRLFIRHLGLALVKDVQLSELRIVEEQHRGSRGIGSEVPDAESGDAHAKHDEQAGRVERAGRVEQTRRVAQATRIVDLSHTIRAGLITYPGLPAPQIVPHLTRENSRAVYSPGTEFEMDLITMIGNTGTYLDSPFHRYANGADLAALSLPSLVGLRAEVLHVADSTTRDIGAEVFLDRSIEGAAVLLHTGWGRHFGTPSYAVGAPYLSESGAQYLADQGATLVGIDSLNIDDTESGGSRPAHSILLAAGIHVVEHLTNLGELPARGSRFTAVPPKIEGFGTFPVRAFATV